jgi:MoxR-like ATPase
VAFDAPLATDVTKSADPNSGDKSEEAVVLLDEIDKADPDVPNNLLVPLGSLQFSVKFPGREVPVRAAKPPLVIITTNDERDLPNAFLRRCVVVRFERPDTKRMVDIAVAHFGEDKEDLYEPVAAIVMQLSDVKERSGGVAPSTAEYLDAISACRKLQVSPSKKKQVWQQVARAVLEKPRPDEETAASR